MQIVSHRGAEGLAPENTLSAFRKGIQSGADCIEFDCRQTNDGVVVVHHDRTIDRMTSGTGPVNQHSLDEIRNETVGEDEVIPTLKEALSLLQRHKIRIQIEIKERGIVEKVEELVKEYNVVDRTMLISFIPEVLENTSEIKTGLLLTEKEKLEKAGIDDVDVHLSNNPIKKADELDVEWIGFDNEYVDEQLIQHANDAFRTGVWTVDEKGELTDTRELPVDSVTTNYPNRAQKIL